MSASQSINSRGVSQSTSNLGVRDIVAHFRIGMAPTLSGVLFKFYLVLLVTLHWVAFRSSSSDTRAMGRFILYGTI